ncbi:MAG TPA: DUF4412 domain-containing protein [Gammaproteobacteria bacterium]
MTRIAVTAAAFVALPAIAGTRIEYVDENSGEARTVLAIKDGKARMDSADDAGYVLFDANARTLTTVNPNEKTFTVMDEASMQQLSAEVSSAMAEMRAQLERMPPEQRAMVEKMMGGAMNAGKSMLETTVERTGRTLEKAGHACEQVIFSVGSVARTELCVADAGEVGVPDEDRATMNAMYRQMQAMAETMMKNFGMESAPDMSALDGIAVYMKQDNEKSGEILGNVTHDGIDASLFAIPDDYREESLRQ